MLARLRLRTRLQPLVRQEDGSASIEFAGAMLVFVLVLIFILQAGAMMVTQVAATNAAREVARTLVTRPPGNPEAALERAAPGLARQMNVQQGGDSVTVHVQLKTPLIFEAVAHWNWWVHASATMRREL